MIITGSPQAEAAGGDSPSLAAGLPPERERAGASRRAVPGLDGRSPAVDPHDAGGQRRSAQSILGTPEGPLVVASAETHPRKPVAISARPSRGGSPPSPLVIASPRRLSRSCARPGGARPVWSVPLPRQQSSVKRPSREIPFRGLDGRGQRD
jgi:hypothetical protein